MPTETNPNAAIPDSGPVVLVSKPATARLAPLGFHIHANNFFELAEKAKGEGQRFVPVAAFLYCRAIELALKAFLLARGQTVDDVVRHGHDLQKLLLEAYARGLDVVGPLSIEERKTICDLHGQYPNPSKLAYFDVSAAADSSIFSLPLEEFAAVTGKLVRSVERGCYEAAQGTWRPF